jgi:hypothetical protein
MGGVGEWDTSSVDFLPSEPISFIWGLVVGGLAVFVGAVVSSAGTDTWAWLKRRLKPPPPESTQVASTFTLPEADPNSLEWILDHRVIEFEARGYTLARHPDTGGPCFFVSVEPQGETRQFLMHKPPDVT